jgi:hypothetical protein
MALAGKAAADGPPPDLTRRLVQERTAFLVVNRGLVLQPLQTDKSTGRDPDAPHPAA